MASLGKCSDLSQRIFTGDEVLAFFSGDFDVTDSNVSLFEESGRNDDGSSKAPANLDDDEWNGSYRCNTISISAIVATVLTW